MSLPMLTTKISIPPVRETRVSRSRLLNRLEGSLSRKLTLISSPAGFGKTTLLSEFASISERPVAWFSIDEDDNDSTRFFVYLIGALRTIQSDFGDSLIQLLQATKQEPVEKLLTILINDINAELTPFVLVLDDYHLIEEQAINQALVYLLDHQPEQMHIMIATRADPDLPLGRLRARDQLNQIRESDLRFTVQETEEFLTRVMGLDLGEEQLAALEGRTEGWAVGLQLAALSLREQADQKEFVEKFTGSNRYILDYLGKEVLDNQTQEVRDFLLRTSILERLSAPLCEALTGLNNCQQILDYLETNHLFILPLDQERTWYRYHRLFQDYLQKFLGDTQPDIVSRLHSEAGQWFERKGFIDAAIDHSIKAGEYEHVGDLIEETAEPRFMRSESSLIIRWINALPEQEILTNPSLCLIKAWALILRGGSAEGIDQCLEIVENSTVDGPLLGSAFALRAFQSSMKGDAQTSLEHSQRALELIPKDSLFLRSMVADNLGMVHLILGDFNASIENFKQAVEISHQAGNLMIEVGALCNMAGIWMLQGQLNKSWTTNLQALELATDIHGHRLPIAGKALLGLGEIAREWNDLDNATSYLNEGLDLFRSFGELGSIVAFVSLARIKEVQGDLDGAQVVVDLARKLAAEFDASALDDQLVEAYQAQLWLLQGRKDQASRWIQENDMERQFKEGSGKPHFDLIWEVNGQTLVKVYMNQGEYENALEVIEPLFKAAEANKRQRNIIKILAMQAAIYQAMGDSKRGLQILERALELGEAEGFVRSFLDEGEMILQLLDQAVSKGIYPDYAKKLIASAKQIKPIGTLVKSDYGEQSELVEPLSVREIEVLQLIADGFSNQEIANQLHISLSTVKGHTSNIYGKLGVHKRTRAVSRAMELGLLPSQ